jgi:hypothetical protein
VTALRADAAHPLAPPWFQELLAEQEGVLTRAQAVAGGLTSAALRWQLERGHWQVLLPGVVVAHSGQASIEQRVWAAVLYGGSGAAVSGEALLHLTSRRWAMPSVIDVAVAASCQVAPREFFRPHRCSRLRALTHPARLPRQIRIAPGVLHAAAWAPTARAAEWRLAAAVQQRLVRPGELRDGLVALPRLPRRALLRRVLDDVELGAHAQTELDFLAFLRRHALPLPDRLQLRVRANGTRYLDCWWQRQRVAVELDGAHHREVTAWDDDALRANAIVVAHRADRVILLRVTAGNLRHAAPELAAQLRSVL